MTRNGGQLTTIEMIQESLCPEVGLMMPKLLSFKCKRKFFYIPYFIELYKIMFSFSGKHD